MRKNYLNFKWSCAVTSVWGAAILSFPHWNSKMCSIDWLGGSVVMHPPSFSLLAVVFVLYSLFPPASVWMLRGSDKNAREMLGKGRIKHLLNKTNPEFQSMHKAGCMELLSELWKRNFNEVFLLCGVFNLPSILGQWPLEAFQVILWSTIYFGETSRSETRKMIWYGSESCGLGLLVLGRRIALCVWLSCFNL